MYCRVARDSVSTVPLSSTSVGTAPLGLIALKALPPASWWLSICTS